MAAPRWVAVGVMGVLVGFVAVTGVATAASASPQPVWVLGDSVPYRMEEVPEATWALEQGMSVRDDMAVCRRLVQPSCAFKGVQPQTVLGLIEQQRHVPATVVVSVGYNDPPTEFAADAESVTRALTQRGATHVVWVTLRESRTSWRQANSAIFALQKRWPGGVSVADWNALSKGQPWFDDEIHLNSQGAVAMARLIRSKVLAACGKACLAPARPPLQPLPAGSRVCLERAGGDWAAVLGTATSAARALALQRVAIAKGFDQSLIVQSTPQVWQVALFGFPTRQDAINGYLEMKSRGFRETLAPNVDKCGDETGTWKAIFGRTTTISAAQTLLARIRAAGFKDGSRIEADAPDNYAVVIDSFQSTKQLPGFQQEAQRAGFIVSFAPN